MTLTCDDKARLQTFSGLSLNRKQLETILRRSLTEREGKVYNRHYRAIFSQVAKHVSNVAARKFKVKNAKPSDENIELWRSAKERKKYIPYFENHKKVFQNIAVDAARKALVKKAKKNQKIVIGLYKSKKLSVNYHRSEKSNLKTSKN